MGAGPIEGELTAAIRVSRAKKDSRQDSWTPAAPGQGVEGNRGPWCRHRRSPADRCRDHAPREGRQSQGWGSGEHLSSCPRQPKLPPTPEALCCPKRVPDSGRGKEPPRQAAGKTGTLQREKLTLEQNVRVKNQVGVTLWEQVPSGRRQILGYPCKHRESPAQEEKVSWKVRPRRRSRGTRARCPRLGQRWVAPGPHLALPGPVPTPARLSCISSPRCRRSRQEQAHHEHPLPPMTCVLGPKGRLGGSSGWKLGLGGEKV